MNKLTRDRREVAVIGGGIAAGSAGAAALSQRHPVLGWVWLAMIFIALAYVVVKLLKIKREKRTR